MKLAAGALCLLASATANAEPYRLRADALASVQSPSGMIAVDAEGDLEERGRAEALLWLGDDSADALVAMIEAEAASGRVVGRLGRFVAIAGALRPVHVDGASARVRLPGRMTVEAFGGIPVSPELSDLSWDWVAGARASRLVGDWGGFGVGWLEQRDGGRLAYHELGVDGGAAIGERTDLGGRVAYDLIHGGLADAQITASTRRGPTRVEVYAGERSPGRLIPATSLFSVLGDVPSRRGGVTGRWRAAPRLDLRAGVGGRAVGDDLGADLSLRADLRLDDRGDGAVALELRRDGAPDGGWTGARATLRRPLPHRLSLGVELELAVPDDPAPHTGNVWPWGLVALGWSRGPWEVAGAVEASSSPVERYRFDALARVGRTWGAP